MTRWLAGLTALLILAGTCLAELRIVGTTKVDRDKIVRLYAEGMTADAALIWDVSDEDRADIEELGGKLYFTGPPGIYKVRVLSVRLKDGKTLTERARATVTIGEVVPPIPPVPPVPPGPTPVPPGPAPIPVAGLRVLIVYESADLAKMTAAQQGILFNKTIRDYMNSVCIVGSDGKTKDWYILDRDSDMSKMPQLWQDAMKRPRASTPWLLISNGKAGYEGPLPANDKEAMALIQKFVTAGRK